MTIDGRLNARFAQGGGGGGLFLVVFVGAIWTFMAVADSSRIDKGIDDLYDFDEDYFNKIREIDLNLPSGAPYALTILEQRVDAYLREISETITTCEGKMAKSDGALSEDIYASDIVKYRLVEDEFRAVKAEIDTLQNTPNPDPARVRALYDRIAELQERAATIRY